MREDPRMTGVERCDEIMRLIDGTLADLEADDAAGRQGVRDGHLPQVGGVARQLTVVDGVRSRADGLGDR